MRMRGKLSVLLLCTALHVHAEDWPTYRHDNRRSGVSAEQLPAQLSEAWTYKSGVPPQTAWSGPAKWDAFSGNKDLQSMRNFDPAFFVTSAGNDVYFGSSVDNAVHCIDAETGKERWVFFTDSAVRFPPTSANGKLYFGSDDGYAYCIDAKTADEIWRYRPIVDKRHTPSNGKLISLWPCRTGVLVQGQRAYFAASMLPWEASYLCAVDAMTGKPEGTGCFEARQTEVTLQGALLASSDSLYAPQGRAAPIVFDKATGKRRGSIPNAGGTYCLLTDDDQLISGPKNQKEKDQVLQVADGTKRNHLLTFQGTNRILVNKGFAYLHQGESLTALDRVPYATLQGEKRKLLGKQAAIAKQLKSRKNDQALKAENAELGRKVQKITASLPQFFKWKIHCEHPIGFAMGGNTLYVGGNGIVQAYDATDGEELWSAKIEGKGYGLAISNGRLLVSTDKGRIHCFK
jgi:outer membrane protein assembly factor BamB